MTASNPGSEQATSGAEQQPAKPTAAEQLAAVHDIQPLDVDGAAGVDDADT